MKTSLWLNVDPLAEKMSNVGSNVYAFNNPILLIDPDGAFPQPWIIRMFEAKWGKTNSIKLSKTVYAQMNKSWNQSFDKNRTSTERGGTFTINRSQKAFEFVNLGGVGSTSGTFQPNININKKTHVLVGTFHTHPYGKNDGAWDGANIPFSGGDFATMDDFDEAVSLNQSGKNVYALVMTSKTPKNLDSAEGFYQTQFDNEYAKQLKNGLSSKNSAEKAGEQATKKTAKQYNMMYFKGENGKELKKQ